MATPPNNPAVASVVLLVTRDVRKFINVLHMARLDNAVLGPADINNMVNVVSDWWQNSYRHVCLPSIVGLSVTATKLDPTNPLQAVGFINGPGDTGTTGQDPGNVTAALSWRTGLAGRKYRGRFYHFGVPGNAINTNDSMTGAFMLAVTQVAQYLLAHAASAALQEIIFHRSTNTYTPINATILDQNVDSQRRRLATRGQ